MLSCVFSVRGELAYGVICQLSGETNNQTLCTPTYMINNSLHTLTNSQSLGQIELCSLTLQRWCGYRKWSPALSVGGLSACVCLCAFCLTLACTSLSVSYPLSWPSSGIHTFILTHILSPQMRPLCQPTCCDITYICVIFFSFLLQYYVPRTSQRKTSFVSTLIVIFFTCIFLAL